MNTVLILDFGSQYTQLIARKIRELGIFSEIVPYDIPLASVSKASPGAIILSGGPQSVYEEAAPHISAGIFQMGVPVLGICYGLQLMAFVLGGKVAPSPRREYGFAMLDVMKRGGLLRGVRNGSQVWMSHGDKVESLPPGFIASGVTANCETAAVENREKCLYGVQFHPEVIHTKQGKKILSNFLFKISGLERDWTMESFIGSKVKEIRCQVGDGKVVCGLSGGVDSLVTSLLVHRAVRDNLHCIFVDNGLLRKGQYLALMTNFRKKFSLNVVGVDASEVFLKRLQRITSPERKRKIIGAVFIEIFEKEAKKIGEVRFLAQGTIYPDVIESNPVRGPSSSIKSHHNVGGLPKGLKFELVEPLRELFKDEVRVLGKELGVDPDFIRQHPFPGPGLAVRIVGEVTDERLRILREADAILLEEIRKARLYNRLWQAFAILLPVRSVGVMGDQRTYQRVVVIRLVQSVDGMTADWFPAERCLLSRISNRIVNEIEGINRVLYDITSKPPGTIEWE
jgi:GMP synthase (glutamine-hydrolysing)